MPDDMPNQPAPATVRRRALIPNGVLGMLLFVIVEIMFFAGFISAFIIARATARPGMWPPPDQPRLPFEETAFNTGALLVSGVLLVVAHFIHKKDPSKARPWLIGSIVLGALFVVLQGSEWLAMIQQGLTLTSSTMGSFFYTIVGCHGLHAVIALGGLLYALARLWRGTLKPVELWTVEVFWFFVVGLWPFIYVLIYR